MVQALRDEFPDLLERVLASATGILADLRNTATPGETTFLPSIWRFLAMFDEHRPTDVVRLSDLDTPPFIPFSPSGKRWEEEKRYPIITASM
jgi:hypothetical protein